MKYLTTLILITSLKTAMAFNIKTEVVIQASPETVWGILTNFNDYPNWNPFIKTLNGDVTVGNKITVQIAPPESKEMTFKPTVLTFVNAKEMSWLGHFLIPGIFDGKHTFELIDNGNGTTTFIQRERFKGILVPFYKKQLNTNTRAGFEAMNQKLKLRSENR